MTLIRQRSGILVPMERVPVIAAAIRRFFADPVFAKGKGSRGRTVCDITIELTVAGSVLFS
jgi:hypothetical protein